MRNRAPTSYSSRSPAAERGGYISAREGYVPGERLDQGPAYPALGPRYPIVRLRGIRMRWFGAGLVLGIVSGILLTVGFSALLVRQVPEIVQSFTGEPDVSVVIGEAYLNREAAVRVSSGYATGLEALTLTDVKLDLSPQNRMDLYPTFRLSFLFFNVDINAAVRNQLSVQEGRLVINMVGDPQLGDLNIPLEQLPFDLKASITSAVDRINNDLLISEINQSLRAGFGESDFEVEGVTTTDNGMIIRMQDR